MSDLAKPFESVITALVTPFYRGEVDESSFVRLLHHQLESGINGFVINGTTGESPTLAWSEVARLFEIAKSETGRQASLIVGTGSNSTAATIEKTKQAESWGADAALVVVPYYNKPPQRGLIAHYTGVAVSSKLPVLIYNVPGRTSCSIDIPSVRTLADQANIVGIKEAASDLQRLREMQTIARKPFWLLSGDDASGVEFCRRGGHGIISVVSHIIPRELVSLVAAARSGDGSAPERYNVYHTLLRWLYVEANPIPVKWALQKMGLLRSAELRLPLVALDDVHAEGFASCLQQLGKI